jgi:hypothetical protein
LIEANVPRPDKKKLCMLHKKMSFLRLTFKTVSKIKKTAKEIFFKPISIIINLWAIFAAALAPPKRTLH